MQSVQSRSYLSTLAHSPSVYITTSVVAAGFFAAARYFGKITPKTFYASLGIAGLVGTGVTIMCWNRLKFEITLEWTKWTSNDWYNEIPLPDNKNEDVKLYLGALPIQGKPQPEASTFISLVEKSELNPTPLSTPKQDLKRILIETPDFEPVSIENMLKAIFRINYSLITTKKPAYVHCKAGRGRSAMAVIGYLMMHHSMSYNEAYDHVKKHRPQINMNAAQQAQMKAFEVTLKTRQSS